MYYLVTALLPIILNVYLSLMVSAVHPKHLGTRLGVIGGCKPCWLGVCVA